MSWLFSSSGQDEIHQDADNEPSMVNQKEIGGHERVHLCHNCGWPFPNPHPSAKLRRSHKKVCGTIEGYPSIDLEETVDVDVDDDDDNDFETLEARAQAIFTGTYCFGTEDISIDGEAENICIDDEDEITEDEIIATPFIPDEELEEITNNFETKISSGGDGLQESVFSGVLNTGEITAVKMFAEDVPVEDFLSMVYIVSRLRHENVLPLIGYCVAGFYNAFAYKYSSIGTLHDSMHGREGIPGQVLSWAQRVNIVVDAARGLEYLHVKPDPPIFHRNINSSNVIIFDDDVAKIAYFDLPNQDPGMTTSAESLGYHGPEYAEDGKLSIKSDIYSFAVLMLELITGRKAVDHTLPQEQQNLVTWVTPFLSEDKVSECVDPKLKGDYPLNAVVKMAAIAEMCLNEEPDFRPTMSIVVRAIQTLLIVNEEPEPSTSFDVSL